MEDAELSLLPVSGPGAGARGRHGGVYLGDVLHAGQRSSGSCHQALTCHPLSSAVQVTSRMTLSEIKRITSVSASR